MKNQWNLPWCVGGDFNEVLKMRERVGCRKVSRGMKQFIKFLDTNELVDLRMFGAQFTWKNHNKLDRFLISTDFDAHYPSISAHVLGRPMSDHSPINLSCEQQNWGPSPFQISSYVSA